jgi:tyrosyl-tRNA synthetase
MQGWDSVEIRADIELGGSEQLFSLMVARDLQRDQGQDPQTCLTLPILRGLDGVRRMGKSLGNYIGVGEPAQVQFDKTMSIPDELMKEWFELLTDRPAAEIATLVSPQTHPMEAKKTLAADIVTFYYGTDTAKVARGEWEKRFSGKQDPTDIPEVVVSAAELKQGKMFICKLLVQSGLATSNSEARRLIEQGGINTGPDRTRLDDPKADVAVTDGMVIRRSTVKIVRVRVA